MVRVMITKGKLILITLILAHSSAFGQTTITLQPSATDGKDAVIGDIQPSNNYGSHPDFAAVAGTNGGNASVLRSFIDFDWSTIPSGATINSAELSLYSYDSPNNGTHTTSSGSNASELKRVTSSWGENTVSWDNQPTSTTQNMVTLAASTSSIQDYLNIDVTDLVQDMIDNPSTGYGFTFSLATEQYYRAMIFGSSDNTDSDLHPKIVITYTEATPGVECISLRPNAVDGKDAVVGDIQPSNNYGSHPDFAAVAGTNGGNASVLRSFIDFDWSSIPSGATINSAELSLYSYDSPNNGTHTTSSGSNASELKRITSSWGENTVSWDNQPTSTTQNMVTLNSSTSSIQDYLNIDVTDLVQDMIDNPGAGYGFMFSLATEQYYRAMIFGSSDNTDSDLHPKIEICYSTDMSIDESENKLDVNIYPNPFSDYVNINIQNADELTSLSLEVYDILGNVILSQTVSNENTRINRANLPSGVYIVKIMNSINGGLITRKLTIK